MRKVQTANLFKNLPVNFFLENWLMSDKSYGHEFGVSFSFFGGGHGVYI